MWKTWAKLISNKKTNKRNDGLVHEKILSMSCLVLSSRLQVIPLFQAYRLGTSILGMIRTAVGHHYKFEFVLWPGLEPRSPVCKASMLTTTPTVPTMLQGDPLNLVCMVQTSQGSNKKLAAGSDLNKTLEIKNTISSYLLVGGANNGSFVFMQQSPSWW